MRERWISLATDRAFMLAMPALAVPSIEKAALLRGRPMPISPRSFARAVWEPGSPSGVQALAILARYPPDE